MNESVSLKVPTFKEVLELVKRLSFIESVSSANEMLRDSNNNGLYDDCLKCFFSLFVERKKQNKNFRFPGIPNNIDLFDETGELIFESTIKIFGLFSNHCLDFFHRMVADFFFEKKKSTVPYNNQIFYISCLSSFAKDKLDVFVINKDGNLRVVDDQKNIYRIREYFEEYIFSKETDFLPIEIDFSDGTRFEFQKMLNDWSDRVSEINKSKHTLLTGAISFFDFLGWKGLWQNNDTQPFTQVTCLIERINKFMIERTSSCFKNLPNRESFSTLLSISDTIAILTPKRGLISESDLLYLHAEIANFILENSCKMGYPIRGAISYGQYSVMNNVMIGPGIDECASWHESCDWIGAHFTPSAQFELLKLDSIGSDKITKFDKIPVKPGYPKLDYCIKWHISEEEFDSMRGKIKSILPSIAAKYLNTYSFLHKEGMED